MINFKADYVRVLDRALDHPIWPINGLVVFPWVEAPKWLREFSSHGGDEEGAIWIPAGFQNQPGEYPSIIDPILRVYHDTDFIQFTNGMLIIWAHS